MNAVAPIRADEAAPSLPMRLPMPRSVAEKLGVDHFGWKTLTETIFPSAKSTDAIVMALSYCRARNLDPFKRPVHIVPMYDRNAGEDGTGGFIETIWPGISELRTTAFRTGQYAGCDDTEFGPDIDHVFKGEREIWSGPKGNRSKRVEAYEERLKFPEWARVTVYRIIGGQRVKFAGPKVYWLESYATQGKTDLPNEMWKDRPRGQLEKCAEAGALRKAFPEELGNTLSAEEMAGRHVTDAPSPPTAIASPEPPREPPRQIEGSVIEPASAAEPEKPPQESAQPRGRRKAAAAAPTQEPAPAPKPEPSAAPLDEDGEIADGPTPTEIIADLETSLTVASTEEQVEEVYSQSDVEAALSNVEGGVSSARALKEKHLGRVREASRQRVEAAGGKGIRGAMDEDRADEALANEVRAAAATDPFSIPEKIDSPKAYRDFIEGAIKASVDREDFPARLRQAWVNTKKIRTAIALDMDVVAELQGLVQTRLTAMENPKPFA